MTKTKLILPKDLVKSSSQYVIPKYEVYFSEKLANRYKPIIFSYQCLSGDPAAVYYRIISKNNFKHICIQYFFYWKIQKCVPWHRYDYEPIYVYLKPDDAFPDMIVNGGLGTPVDCNFHKNEIRPKTGRRSIRRRTFSRKLSPKPFYPFGKLGNVTFKGCTKNYPLRGKDLYFQKYRSKFGIAVCSNVFSGAKSTLVGKRFNPPLKKLTNQVLNIWYFKHYNDEIDVPFGHDIADPFSYPHIKYHTTKEFLPKP